MSFTRNLNNYLKENNHYHRLETTKNLCYNDNDSNNNISEWSNHIEDYQFLQQIGSGSFGQVFKSCLETNECAIKRICKSKSPNIGKILSEVSIHIRLSHRHILQLYNVVEDRQNVYLIMELCHGGSLAQLLSREVEKRRTNERLSPNDLLIWYKPKSQPILPYWFISKVLIQLCDSLGYLHRNNIMHRDLNLNNILLVNPIIDCFNMDHNNLQIKLADFGLAIDCNASIKEFNQKKLDTVNKTNNSVPIGTTICGTPGFISPEVWTQRQTVSPKSDIYSLGSIVFACVAGYTPNGNIVLDNFPPMVSELITKLLEDKPEMRPTLDQVIEHIFVSGRINSKRLLPLEKSTKQVQMSIEPNGNVRLVFEQDKLSFIVSRDGSLITIASQNQQRVVRYSFYDLPQTYWKRYNYLVRFITLVQAKTAKITFHCESIIENTESMRKTSTNEDTKKEFISKCILMENGDFEVTIHNQLLNEDFKFLFENNGKMSKKYYKYRSKLENIHQIVLESEMKLMQLSSEFQIDLFPITSGIDRQICRMIGRVEKAEIESKPIMEEEDQSKILQSIHINDIGCATQFMNGSIKVNFNDGSDLCMDRQSQIFYIENNVLKIFNKNEILPEIVVKKNLTYAASN